MFVTENLQLLNNGKQTLKLRSGRHFVTLQTISLEVTWFDTDSLGLELFLYTTNKCCCCSAADDDNDDDAQPSLAPQAQTT